jgi:hypothetical protein
MITPAKFEDGMRSIASHSTEEDWGIADAADLMCDVLVDLGYESGVKLFKEMVQSWRK